MRSVFTLLIVLAVWIPSAFAWHVAGTVSCDSAQTDEHTTLQCP
jgi:hypothetical protein